MPKPFTHIIVKYPSKNMDLLYRANGMALGCRTQLAILFGENPDPKKLMQRQFLDQTFAEMYLRECAHMDANHLTPDNVRVVFGPGDMMPYAASIDERDGELMIVKPNGLVTPNGQLVNSGGGVRTN